MPPARRIDMAFRARHGLLVAAFLATGALIFAACGGNDDQGDGYTIGVNLSQAADPFFVAMEEGINDEAEELGVETVVAYHEYDPADQLADVQDLVAQGVDGIITSPADVEAAIPAYEQARDAGIPIMSIADHTDPDVEDSFIGADWAEFGAAIAEWTCDEADGEGNIAMIKGPPGVSFVEEMDEGYTGYIDSNCPGMSVVFDVNGDTTREAALGATQDALAAHPDLRAVFTQIDDMAAGAIQALEEANQLDDVIVTGFNGDEVGFSHLQDGTLDMTIALKPYQWGRLGVQTMVEYLNGEEVPDLVEIDSQLLDQTNVDEVSFEELR
jgi:ribose transport system substrate-binding protein